MVTVSKQTTAPVYTRKVTAAEVLVGMEYESLMIAAAVVAVVLLSVCYRRRRKVVGTVPAGPQEVMEDFTRSSSTSHTAESPIHGNSIFEVCQEPDVSVLADRFHSLQEVSETMRRAGLESCNLIFGIDYTGSNYMQGKKTFGGKCLHHIDSTELNPYQKVICVLGETLEPFDEDGVIPAYGFGDTFTRDHSVFSLSNMGPCHGFQEVLRLYNEITPKVHLGGPTNFAPLIRQAIGIVKKNKSFHILVIVADGQVTAERDTTDAIVEASNWPLSIIMVGVGDGPWDTMKDFDEKLPKRRFDNFKFVNFSAAVGEAKNPQAAFALHALMEIPDHYKAIRRLGLLDISE